MKYRDSVRLSDIKPGQRATVLAIDTEGSMRRRFFDIGLIENTAVECIGRSPAGDPSAYLIRGAVVAIRKEDTQNITVMPEAAKCPCKEVHLAGRAVK